jgi:tetrahydromethanopterin S-methyltransferase subunit B
LGETVRALEVKVKDIEESQTRHRDLLDEMRSAMHQAEKRWDTFMTKVDVAVTIGKMTLGAIGVIAAAIITALIAKVIHQ